MRRVLVGLLLVLLLPSAAASDVRVDQTVTIDVGADGIERIRVVVHGQNAFPESIRVPRDVNVTRVHNFGTPIQFEVVEAGEDKIVRPKGHSFDWTVEGTRARNASLAPIVLGSYFVGAFTVRNDIRITLNLPPGAEFIDATMGTIDASRSSLRVVSNATTHLRYSYREALDPALHAEVREGIFAAIGPASRSEEMRMVARIATRATTEAAAFAGLPVQAPIWARYAPAEHFEWQDGFATGVNVVVVRESDLERASHVGFPWDAAGVLTHEAFHVVSIPRSSGGFGTNSTWWTEGAAVYAERFATGVNGFSSCGVFCHVWQTQLRREALESLYAANGSLDPTWTTAASAHVDRARSYALSGFIVASYVERFGREAYMRAWSAYRNATIDPAACPCDHKLVEGILATAAGRERIDDLYAPYRALYVGDREAFARAVGPLTARDPDGERPFPVRFPSDAPDTFGPWRPRLAIEDPTVRSRSAEGIEVSLVYHDLVPHGATPVPLDDRPLAELRIVVDGEEVAPSLLHRDGKVVFALPASTGAHEIRIEARAPGRNATLATLDRPLDVRPFPVLHLVARPDGSAVATVTDGPRGPPVPGIEVRFDLDVSTSLVEKSDAEGRAVFPPPAAPGPYTLMAQVMEEGVVRDVGSADLLVPQPPPLPPSPAAEPTPSPMATAPVSPSSEPSPTPPTRPSRSTPPAAREADVPLSIVGAIGALALVAFARRQR